MNEKEWYAKLEEWAFDDARLHRMPLALLPILAEHLANHEAVEQGVQRTLPTGDGIACPICGEVNYCIHRDN